MNAYEHNQKMQAAQKQIAGLAGSDTCCNQAQAMGINPEYRRPSPREEAEKNSAYHQELASTLRAGVEFLRENPQFDEFIRLIRAGSIQI